MKNSRKMRGLLVIAYRIRILLSGRTSQSG